MGGAVGPLDAVASAGHLAASSVPGRLLKLFQGVPLSQILIAEGGVKDVDDRKASYSGYGRTTRSPPGLRVTGGGRGSTHRGAVSRSACVATMRVLRPGWPDG